LASRMGNGDHGDSVDQRSSASADHSDAEVNPAGVLIGPCATGVLGRPPALLLEETRAATVPMADPSAPHAETDPGTFAPGPRAERGPEVVLPLEERAAAPASHVESCDAKSYAAIPADQRDEWVSVSVPKSPDGAESREHGAVTHERNDVVDVNHRSALDDVDTTFFRGVAWVDGVAAGKGEREWGQAAELSAGAQTNPARTEANSAEGSTAPSSLWVDDPEKSNRILLRATVKRVKDDGAVVGISSAKDCAVVAPSIHTNPPFAPEPSNAPVGATSRMEFSADAPPGREKSAAEASAVAHRAVEAVAAATERMAAGDGHAMKVKLVVGGSDLSVHVALRLGEIHTTFCTNSSALRAALAHEWPALEGATERPLRLAAPVFTTDGGPESRADAFGSGGGGHQREPEFQYPTDAATAFSQRRPAGPDLVAAPAAPLRPSGAHPTARHLQTLA
jgi:hypothetical protein